MVTATDMIYCVTPKDFYAIIETANNMGYKWGLDCRSFITFAFNFEAGEMKGATLILRKDKIMIAVPDEVGRKDIMQNASDWLKTYKSTDNKVLLEEAINRMESLRIDVESECAYRDPTGVLEEKLNRANEMLDECINVIKRMKNEIDGTEVKT